MVRLGAGGLDGRTLSRIATTTAIQTLSKFKQLAETHRVDDVLAAATSAVREAKNGGEFLADVARRTGIRARVVSGVEEARLDSPCGVLRRRRRAGCRRRHRHRRGQCRDHAWHGEPHKDLRAALRSASYG